MQKEDGKWMRFCENKFAFHDKIIVLLPTDAYSGKWFLFA